MAIKKQQAEMINYTGKEPLETNLWKISTYFDYFDTQCMNETVNEDPQEYIKELIKRCEEQGFKFMSANFDIHQLRFKVMFDNEMNNVIVKVSSKSMIYRMTVCKTKNKKA